VAASAGFPKTRVDEVIELTGMQSVKKKQVGSFSLGMAQRVSIAIAMMGQPDHLILDEPVNGLDPEGIAWVRATCREYAQSGKAVLISSHLMSELQQTVDRVVVIGKGKKLAEGTLSEIMQTSGENTLENAYFKLTQGSVEFQTLSDPKLVASATSTSAATATTATTSSEPRQVTISYDEYLEFKKWKENQ
jgi:ABC-2 type transport system ATP-binding protein